MEEEGVDLHRGISEHEWIFPCQTFSANNIVIECHCWELHRTDDWFRWHMHPGNPKELKLDGFAVRLALLGEFLHGLGL